MTPKRETILEEAARMAEGALQDDYGDATETFQRIAEVWSAAVFNEPVTALQVAQAMMAVELCLFRTAQNRGNLVDLAGYAQLAADIEGL